jgi:hypothetical protein
MLNFGSAQVGGGGGQQYWEEVAVPIFGNDTLLKNNDSNSVGVVGMANNTPSDIDTFFSSYYDSFVDVCYNIIGTAENGNFKTMGIFVYNRLSDLAECDVFTTGVINNGIYTGNDYDNHFFSTDTFIAYYYQDVTRNLGMASVIQNDFNSSDMGWSIQSTNVSGYVFGIDENGRICTNQIVPNTPHSSPTGELPIYDNTGTYLGKILVY